MTAERAGTDMRVVPMTREHISALMPYERQMFGTEAWTESGYRTELADTRHRFYVVAEHGDELVGWAGVMVIGDEAQILTVGVVPDARRRGIGRALLDALIAEAVRRGAVAAFLEVRVDNEPARTLYERDGFVEIATRPGYYDAGRVDAVVMRRDL